MYRNFTLFAAILALLPGAHPLTVEIDGADNHLLLLTPLVTNSDINPWVQFHDEVTICGISDTGDRAHLMSLTNKIFLNENMDLLQNVTAPAGTCTRVWCSDSSAVHLCNWTTQQAGMSIADLAKRAQRARQACCRHPAFDGVSGLVASLDKRVPWVYVGKGDCNADPVSSKPPPKTKTDDPKKMCMEVQGLEY